jgi:hypothetical protein
MHSHGALHVIVWDGVSVRVVAGITMLFGLIVIWAFRVAAKAPPMHMSTSRTRVKKKQDIFLRHEKGQERSIRQHFLSEYK